ncbi:DUF2637 domain-containing protein [Streptomyces sp. MI02-2A]|uniref:DUF2637 domain-containing protein n=1 Tax=unclassified Streptomyces TaxID=2593676 RepID=UPI000E271213|nr:MULTISPECIES: DUF2637 domain-containing protein [unclassified Streptomyces]MDX3264615.1 DUF2637 domain-containing protein [Streptomyces sp. MI02-2A]REE61740.1 uncharacterized protein DUF2637 [Streptomyces sp. 3212.3]
MTKPQAERTALLAAGVVILALTGAAFWLSYAHLAGVAKINGLASSTARMWAWPATLDLFIVAGEVLMFRAALRHVTDWWAVGLTVAGSLGSIGLNVAGVGGGQPVLHYVVAAVPPSAALLAFGALMRQVHHLVDPAAPAEHNPASLTVPDAQMEPVERVSLDRIPDPAPAPELPAASRAAAATAPAVPPALLDHARSIANTHRNATGEPITADALTARLGLPASTCQAIATQLQLA